MAVLDASTFEEDNFDACGWLNAEISERLAQGGGVAGGSGELAGANNNKANSGVGESAAVLDVDAQVLEHLGDLELKIQLIADDLDSNIEELASKAYDQLPSARVELDALQERTNLMQKQIFSILGNISQTQESVGYTMGNIQLVDKVQTNMQSARDALGEAAGMAQLLATVEQTFKQGDLTTIGRQLKQIREGLESVSGVREFAGVETKLHEFEERLQAMIQTPLQKAFEDHDAESVRHLSSILVLSNKSDSIGTLFVSAKIFKLQSSWESFSPIQGRGPESMGMQNESSATRNNNNLTFEEWLPEWLQKVLSIVETEHKWCLDNLPDQADSLLVTVIETCFISIKQSFKNRLQNALSMTKAAFDGGDSEVSPLHVLLKVKTSLKEFITSVEVMLTKSSSSGNSGKGEEEDSKGKLLECLALCTYGQIKDQVLLYPLLERQGMTSFLGKLGGELQQPIAKLKQMTAASTKAGLADAIEACTQIIQNIINPASKIGEDSVQRCLGMTDGFKLDELLLVIDECLAAFLNKVGLSLKAIQENVKDSLISNRAAAASKEEDLDMASQSQEDALPEDILVAILRVLQTAVLFSNSMSILEANLHSSVSVLKAQWEHQSNIIHVWFTLFPGQKEVHEKKLASLQGGSISLLPLVDKSVKEYKLSAEQIVLDFMMIKVKKSLQGIDESKLWSRTEAKDKTFDLPSFSVFPSKHVTSLGEYLLIVPQQFDVLDDLDELKITMKEGKGNNEEEEPQQSNSFAAEWITRVVEEASKLYTRDILRIPKLSEHGCSQLQADIDYLCNILQALFVAIPLKMSTIASNLSLSNEEIKEQKNQPKDCDAATWDKIVKMRLEA